MTLTDAAALSGGLLVGEGDSGKTTYLEMLQEACLAFGPTKLIRLRSSDNFLARFHAILSDAKRESRRHERVTLLFDGLDENERIINELMDFVDSEWVREKNVAIWISSRPIPPQKAKARRV